MTHTLNWIDRNRTVWRLLYLCSKVTLSSNVGENVRWQYRTTQALNILRNYLYFIDSFENPYN